MMTPSLSTTMGTRQPNSLIDAATLSTARSGILRLLRAYGIGRAIGHEHTSRSFIRAPTATGIWDLSEVALCARLANRALLYYCADSEEMSRLHRSGRNFQFGRDEAADAGRESSASGGL